MKTFDELLKKDGLAWKLVQESISTATNKVEVLACEKEISKKTLIDTQVTTNSTMGAVIYHTGGILIDNGWIRILGSSTDKIPRAISDWNSNNKEIKNYS